MEQIELPNGVGGNVVLVVDPYSGTGGGLPALSGCAADYAVLVMSTYIAPHVVREAFLVGVRGYVGKDVSTSALLSAANAVAVGGMYITQELRDVLAPTGNGGTVKAHAEMELSPRERDVLTMVAQGFTHKQIGSRLGLSKATVDTYVHRIRRKVGVGNKAGLTRVALDLDLLNEGV
ncbi:response regulator transcription factor [Nonomuraea sp. NPDC049695]|uniref:response regulator transcription factor n=1 Tax=Nonomuraea sp. NPDC049695 TaxID=3154734 RepID=UPI003441B34A